MESKQQTLWQLNDQLRLQSSSLAMSLNDPISSNKNTDQRINLDIKVVGDDEINTDTNFNSKPSSDFNVFDDGWKMSDSSISGGSIFLVPHITVPLDGAFNKGVYSKPCFLDLNIDSKAGGKSEEPKTVKKNNSSSNNYENKYTKITVDKRFLPPSESLPRKKTVGGYVLVCNNDAIPENLKRQLFGFGSGRAEREEAVVVKPEAVAIDVKSEAKQLELSDVFPLYEAICANDWTRAKVFLDEHQNALAVPITASGKTALHVAALFGHLTIVEKLLKLMPPELLETVDAFGNTPLSISAYVGIIQVAKCLVDKNPSMLGIPNSSNQLPVTVAFLNGHQKMGRYLYYATSWEFLKQPSLHARINEELPSILSQFLRCCMLTQCYDIVLDWLQGGTYGVIGADSEEWRLVDEIATMNSGVPSQSELVFWKRWIYNYINIPSTPDVDLTRGENRRKKAEEILNPPGHGLLQRLISYTYNFTGVKKIQELKLLHAQAAELFSQVCKEVKLMSHVNIYAQALFLAAEHGNDEFVFRVSKANPEILLTGDSSHRNIFYYAVEHRQAKVFNLAHGLRFKDVVATSRDKDGNTLLHMAAKLAPDHVLNRVYVPTLQMQRELQWFKEVESLIPPTIRAARNNDGMTAEELFRESHKELMKQGEKWIKATASSCSFVGALIVTIVFAAAFTVPGGNDQNLGYPLFIKQPFFEVFIFSAILSLISASTSVLIFLAILTFRYSQEKFLKCLPRNLIFGLSSLFMSIVTMMIAFLSTIRLMLKHTNYSWGLLPIIILASVPIFLFVLSQFPLLLHSAFSTYVSIFNRKVELWP